MHRTARASRVLTGSLLVAFAILGGGAGSALAQAAAPGEEVPYIDDQGVTHGTIQVKQVEAPFTEFEPTQPPPDGSKYVGLIVAFTAADDQRFDTNPYGVTLQDTNGHLWSPTFVPRPADAIVPDSQSQAMGPGNRLSGFIGYIVPSDVVIDQVVYQPDYYRAILLADLLPGAGPAPGTSVEFTTDTGAGAAVSAEEITDPFTDNDPNGPPPEGTRYVEVNAAFDNTGAVRFPADPGQILLHASDGHLIYPTYVPRPQDAVIPDLESQTLSPGDHISGAIGYEVPVGLTITSVDYQPDNTTRLVLADLSGGASVQPEASAAPGASRAPVPSASVAP